MFSQTPTKGELWNPYHYRNLGCFLSLSFFLPSGDTSLKCSFFVGLFPNYMFVSALWVSYFAPTRFSSLYVLSFGEASVWVILKAVNLFGSFLVLELSYSLLPGKREPCLKAWPVPTYFWSRAGWACIINASQFFPWFCGGRRWLLCRREGSWTFLCHMENLVWWSHE